MKQHRRVCFCEQNQTRAFILCVWMFSKTLHFHKTVFAQEMSQSIKTHLSNVIIFHRLYDILLELVLEPSAITIWIKTKQWKVFHYSRQTHKHDSRNPILKLEGTIKRYPHENIIHIVLFRRDLLLSRRVHKYDSVIHLLFSKKTKLKNELRKLNFPKFKRLFSNSWLCLRQSFFSNYLSDIHHLHQSIPVLVFAAFLSKVGRSLES